MLRGPSEHYSRACPVKSNKVNRQNPGHKALLYSLEFWTLVYGANQDSLISLSFCFLASGNIVEGYDVEYFGD